jgi:hypothetical protein
LARRKEHSKLHYTVEVKDECLKGPNSDSVTKAADIDEVKAAFTKGAADHQPDPGQLAPPKATESVATAVD